MRKLQKELRNRVAAEKKVEREHLAAKKAEALAARKTLKAAQQRVSIQRRAFGHFSKT